MVIVRRLSIVAISSIVAGALAGYFGSSGTTTLSVAGWCIATGYAWGGLLFGARVASRRYRSTRRNASANQYWWVSRDPTAFVPNQNEQQTKA